MQTSISIVIFFKDCGSLKMSFKPWLMPFTIIKGICPVCVSTVNDFYKGHYQQQILHSNYGYPDAKMCYKVSGIIMHHSTDLYYSM